MSKDIRADYETVLLFPRAIEEWVSAEHPARFLREFVDALDLAAMGFEMGAEERGRPGYSSDLLLKVWLYGYCFGIRSVRSLERACREHLSLVWLTGTYAPDHNTLWRFWTNNRVALREVFTQSLRVAMQANLVGFVLHALDGTKIQARASTRTILHRGQLTLKAARLQARIDEIEQSIAGSHEPDTPGYELPKQLATTQGLRDVVRASLAQLDQAGVNHLHPCDSDARIMQTTTGRALSFNAQAVTDEHSGMIVAADVCTSPNDQRQLVPMLDKVSETLGRVAEQTVADAGYDTAESIARAEQKQYAVVVASKTEARTLSPYHSTRFHYDADHETVICPRGDTLKFIGVRTPRQKPYPVRVYRCTNTQCPVRDQCTKLSRGREIEISPHHDSVARQAAKREDPQFKMLLRKRQQIAELPFAIIKELRNYRRAARHGLENVRTEWRLICAAFNLAKLWKSQPT